jgi:hypothetical protein
MLTLILTFSLGREKELRTPLPFGERPGEGR